MRARIASGPRHRRPIARALLAIACVLAPAPAAVAQDPSPRVDRNTPAGTEYELPIEAARRQATGGGDAIAAAGGASGGPAASQGAPPLFGEGISTPPRTPRTPRTAGRGAEPATRSAPPPNRRTRPPQSVLTQARAPEGAGGALLAVGGAALGALLMGALAGLAWRRRTTRR